MFRSLIVATGLLVTMPVLAAPVAYKMDPNHTDVVASWNHMGLSNPMAHFGQVDGTIMYDAVNPTQSSVDVTIPLSGLNSHIAKFDEHLRSGDLFDAQKYPTITFKSTKVEMTGKDTMKVYGTLTLRGVSKPVVLDATLNGQGMHPMSKRPAIGFDATATVKRSDFGMIYALPAVSDNIQIRITTEALGEKKDPNEKTKKNVRKNN